MSVPFVIETRDLTKVYGAQVAVNHLNLRVPRGCVYGFLGRNGAGKSTTIKMLTGMAQPTSGECRLLGDDSRNLSPETRQRVAYIAEGHPLPRWMSVASVEKFTKAFYPGWNSQLFQQIVDHFELPRKKRISSLSNGQRAQVSLALAVAPDPELLILDDPTLGLDPVVRRDFLESLIQIIQSEGRTILFSSHILNDVERMADRIGIMVQGVLRVDCPTDHFKQSLRRIVMEFKGDAPAFPPLPGVVSARSAGPRCEVLVANYTPEHLQAAESLHPRTLEVLELNLEDAFIEYTRGPRKSLPPLLGQGKFSSGKSTAGAAT